MMQAMKQEGEPVEKVNELCSHVVNLCNPPLEVSAFLSLSLSLVLLLSCSSYVKTSAILANNGLVKYWVIANKSKSLLK